MIQQDKDVIEMARKVRLWKFVKGQVATVVLLVILCLACNWQVEKAFFRGLESGFSQGISWGRAECIRTIGDAAK